MFSKKSYFWKNYDVIENIWKKVNFFLAIFKFLMAIMDAQQNFMPLKYIFFFLSLLDQKLKCFLVKKFLKLNDL